VPIEIQLSGMQLARVCPPKKQRLSENEGTGVISYGLQRGEYIPNTSDAWTRFLAQIVLPPLSLSLSFSVSLFFWLFKPP